MAAALLSFSPVVLPGTTGTPLLFPRAGAGQEAVGPGLLTQTRGGVQIITDLDVVRAKSFTVFR